VARSTRGGRRALGAAGRRREKEGKKKGRKEKKKRKENEKRKRKKRNRKRKRSRKMGKKIGKSFRKIRRISRENRGRVFTGFSGFRASAGFSRWR
jgi:hypothetical protein